MYIYIYIYKRKKYIYKENLTDIIHNKFIPPANQLDY